MELLSAGEVCEALADKNGKFPYRTLDSWVRARVVHPFVEANGFGRHRMFRLLPDVLAIAAGRGLRAKGFPFESAAAVIRTIMEFSEQQILGWFAEDRTHLLFMGRKVMPALSRKDAARESIAEVWAVNTTDLQPDAIDLKRLYRNILAVRDQKASKARA